MTGERRLIDANELYLGKFLDARTDYHIGWNDALDAAASQANTVDAVEVVHGQWVHDGEDTFHCSVCGYADAFPHMDDGIRPHKYCPDCGVKLDGGADNGI